MLFNSISLIYVFPLAIFNIKTIVEILRFRYDGQNTLLKDFQAVIKYNALLIAGIDFFIIFFRSIIFDTNDAGRDYDYQVSLYIFQLGTLYWMRSIQQGLIEWDEYKQKEVTHHEITANDQHDAQHESQDAESAAL